MENNMIGLPNLGKTCFINSCVQALLSCKGILHEIRTRNVSGDVNKRVQKITYSDKGLPVQRLHVCNLLMHIYSRDHPEYTIGESQDCSEFLTYYLEELKTIDQKIKIQTITKNRVTQEVSITESFENILFLPLMDIEMNPYHNIYECISGYNTVEYDFGNIEYKILETGKQIFIGLKRFIGVMFNGNYISRKLNIPITMNDNITILVNNVRVSFCLVSVIMHFGQLQDGHYITYRKIRNQWTYADDEDIGFLNKKSFDNGYIYVYEREI